MEGPLSGAPGEERAYKRDPVLRLSAKGRPSLWDRRCRRPRAAYPGASNGPFAPCLALLRAGLAEPRRSPVALVSSYLTVSPLPAPVARRRRLFSVALSPGHPGWALPTALPYGVPTFLDTVPDAAAARPALRCQFSLLSPQHRGRYSPARPRACSSRGGRARRSPGRKPWPPRSLRRAAS
jgi:hypothetical protein